VLKDTARTEHVSIASPPELPSSIGRRPAPQRQSSCFIDSRERVGAAYFPVRWQLFNLRRATPVRTFPRPLVLPISVGLHARFYLPDSPSMRASFHHNRTPWYLSRQDGCFGVI